MKCKLTGSEGPPVDAHIIPRSFYDIDPEERLPTKIISNITGQYPRRSPIGIYDSTIVTKEGEALFSPWDDYATEILIHGRPNFEKILLDGRVAGLTLPQYDYAKLKLFALSILWRASASSHHFFRKVCIGPHEKYLREMLLNSDPGPPDLYSVIFTAWSDRTRNPGIMDPFKSRFDNVAYYLIYLANYIMYVKVDKQLSNDTFRATQLKPNSNLVLIAREMNNSKELTIMANLVKLHAK